MLLFRKRAREIFIVRLWINLDLPNIYSMGNCLRVRVTLECPIFAWRTSVKYLWKKFSTNIANWVAQDLVGSRAAVFVGAKSYEPNSVRCAVEARQRRNCLTVDDIVFYYCRWRHALIVLTMSCALFYFPMAIVSIDQNLTSRLKIPLKLTWFNEHSFETGDDFA